MKEFNCSYRMATQSKDMKNCGGVLAVQSFKRGTNSNEENYFESYRVL